MAYFRAMSSAAGGTTATITVTYGSTFYNKTMTCTNGTKTYTKTTTSSGSTTFNVYEEGTWTITCNDVSRTVNVVFSYTTQMTITKTVTVYGASGATISFSDTTGSKTVTLNSSGEDSVSITFIPNQSITFTDTNVAKNPNNLSQNYSKAIKITSSTTSIKVMPENAIYWYGYKSSNYQKGGNILVNCSGSISENTNNITLNYNEQTMGFGHIGCALTKTMDISRYNKMCGIASAYTYNPNNNQGKGYHLTDTPLTGISTGGPSVYGYTGTTPSTMASMAFNQDGTLEKQETDISNYNSGSIGIVLVINGGPYTSTFHALWLE